MLNRFFTLFAGFFLLIFIQTSAAVLPNPTVTGTSKVCLANSASMTASISPGDPLVTFRWYNTNNPLDLIPIFTGSTYTSGPLLVSRSYYVEAFKASTGEKSTRTQFDIEVLLLNVDVPIGTPDDPIVCNGASTILRASSLVGATTFAWFDAPVGGNFLGSGSTLNTGPLATTKTFYLQSSLCLTLLSVRTPVLVIVLPALDIPIATPTDLTLCKGDSTSVTATSLLSNPIFHWYDDLSNPVPVFTGNPFNTGALNSSATFYVESEDANGCKSVRAPAPQVLVLPNADVPIVTPDDLVLCSGDSTNLTATSIIGNTIFKWYSNVSSNTPIFTGNPFNTGRLNAPSTFYVESEDGSGCRSLRVLAPALTVLPAINPPLVNPPLTTICSGQSATFSASSLLGNVKEYRWYDSISGGTLLFTGANFFTGPINNTGAIDATRTYFVELEDNNGCISTRSVATVVITPALDVPIVVPPTQTTCSGDSVSFTASALLGGTTFFWYDSLSGGNLLAQGATFNTGKIENTSSLDLTKTYYVEVRDGMGCSSLRTPAIAIFTPLLNVPIVTPSLITICNGDSASFTASSVLPGTFSYQWYDQITAGTLLFTGNPFNTGKQENTSGIALTRTYFVQMTDSSGCNSLRAPAVLVIRPALDVPTVSPATQTICNGNAAEFVAGSLLGSLTTFEWYDALLGGSLVFTGDTFNTGIINNNGTTDLTRTYYLQGKDSSGCASVRIPVVLIIRPLLDVPLVNPPLAIICNGQSAEFTASSLLTTDAQFYWYDALNGGSLLFTGPTFNTGTINNATAANLSKSYFVEVRDTILGCTSIRIPVQVIIRPALDVPLVIPPAQTICNGTKATITATSLLGNTTFEWYDTLLGGNLLFAGNPFTTDTLINATITNATRTFYVQVKDTAGCASLRTPAIIIITPALDLPLVVPPLQTICSGDSASFEASALLSLGPNINYRWYDALFGGTKLFEGNPYNTGTIQNTTGLEITNTYYVELYDSTGCTSLRTPAVLIVRPALDLPLVNPPLATICSNDTVAFIASSLLMDSLQYYWYDTLDATIPVFVGDTFLATNSNANTANLIKIFYVEGENADGCRTIRVPVTLITRPLVDVPVAAPIAPICGGFSATLVASSPITGNETYWFDAPIGGNQLAVGDTFITPKLYFTVVYYASVKDSSGCESVRIPVVVPVLSNLDQPNVAFNKAQYCVGQSVTAIASSKANLSHNWYSDTSLSNLIFVGDTFTFTAVQGLVFYVEGVNIGGCKSLPTQTVVPVSQGINVQSVIANCASNTKDQIIIAWDSVSSAKQYLVSVDTGKNFINIGLNTAFIYNRMSESERDVAFIIASIAKDTCATVQRADTIVTCSFINDPNPTQECIIDNAITPNDDGVNDFWTICPEILTYPDVKVTIFDRWGKETFRTNNYNTDNSGSRFPKTSTSVVDGTYFYILEVPSREIKKSGYIMIIR